MTESEHDLASLTPDQRRLVERWLRTSTALAPPRPDPTLIPRRRITDPCPLTFAQQQLWFLYHWNPHSTAYTFPLAVRLQGPCDLTILRHSLQAIVARHESLRTTFVTANGLPQQIIAPARELLLWRFDLGALPPAIQAQQTDQILAAMVAWPFDLAHGPLLRACLLRLSATTHILLITVHHIVFDDWSQGVLVRELITLYSARCAERTSLLPDLPIQYGDYAAWRRQRAAAGQFDDQLAFWTAQLHDAPVQLDLPTDYPRPPVASTHGASYFFALPTTLTARLQALSRQTGATLFMTLLAAFSVLLSRLSGQTDLLIGTPIAGRTRAELEGLIGLFVNLLALRIRVGKDRSFRALLQQVRGVALAAYDHQDVAFEQVLQALALARDPSRHPLFQVLLVLQTAPLPTLEHAGLGVEPLEVRRTTARYDLMLFMREEQAGLRGRIEYRTELFEAATIARLSGQFQTLLAGIIANQQASIADLPLMTAVERTQILEAWNATDLAFPSDASIHGLLATHVARTPDTIALVDGEHSVSYHTLHERATQLARHLRALGVGPEVRVGVALPRSLDALLSLLAILAASGAYVPLDPSYPADRLAFMQRDAQLQALIAAEPLPPAVHDQRATVVNLTNDWPTIARLPTTPLPASISAEQLIYVIYTSGSTGSPKGVLGLQRGLLNRCAWMWTHFPFAADEVACQKTALSFVDSVWEIFGSLLAGVRLVVIPETTLLDPLRLIALLDDQRVTRIVLVPSLLRVLLDLYPDLAARVPTLEQWVSSGEALPRELVELFEERLPRRQLLNLYGSSEVAADVLAVRVDGHSGSRRAPPIGRPIANAQAYVLDARMQAVPIGVIGELYIGGAGLARGYLGRPDLTAARFVPNPFTLGSGVWGLGSGVWGLGSGGRGPGADPEPQTRNPEPRLYRTGDLARYRADGQIEYLGRADQQIKLRGRRIELGEIETVLAQHTAVQACAALLREDAPGDQRLVAYVVQEPGVGGQEPADPASAILNPDPRSLIPALRVWLAARLPAYMVPAAFVLLEALPLTPNGKLDRRALPAPDPAGATPASVAPRDAVEELLAGIWAEMLRRERVGVHDNFFEHGGHSLLATQAVARVRQVFGVELPLHALFEQPTVAGLADQLRRPHDPTTLGMFPPLQPQPRDRSIPLSFGQERLWFLQQLDPASSAYHLPYLLRLAGWLDLRALARTITALVARHESLRTTFVRHAGQLAQQIAPPHPLPIPLLDLRALPLATRERSAAALARTVAQRPFDLARGPLLRVALLRLAADDHLLLLTIHHIIFDGWSQAILAREAGQLYTAFHSDRRLDLPALPLQYADYAIWQRAWLASEAIDRQIAYWRTQLAGAPPLLDLPTDRPRPQTQTFRGAQQISTLPPALVAALHAASRGAGATLFMTLLAAFGTVLTRYSGQTDLCLGAFSANRTHAEIAGLIGFFVNTLVLRCDLSGNPPFHTLVERVRTVTLGAYAHQAVPIEKLLEVVAPARDLRHTAFFQVMLVLQNLPGARMRLPELAITTPATPARQHANLDLTLWMQEQAEGLAIRWEYRTDLFDATTIARMAGHFQTLLAGIVGRGAALIADLPLLTAAERAQILVAWNAPAARDPRCAFTSVYALFAAQATRTPEAIAVVCGEQHLSYAALAARASQLAGYLRVQGGGAEVVVGVCLERSLDLLVGLLGILKAGGAYLPLDPSYPAQRLAFMLADARVAALLTHERLVATLPAQAVTTLCLDRDWPQIAQAAALGRSAGIYAEQCAYVIYTSGSTGQPKGVAISQRALANAARAWQAAYQLVADDRHLQMASVAFDVFTGDLARALSTGATLVLCPRERLLDPSGLADLLVEQRITCAEFVPAVVRQLVEHLQLVGGRFDGMRLVICGSDSWPEHEYQQARAICGPHTRLINSFGLTEATIDSTYFDGTTSQAVRGQSVLIGRPFGATQLYLLDAQMRPVPIGVPGELYLSGAGLARGYLGRPDLTAVRFVPNPFADEGRQLPDEGGAVAFIAHHSSRMYRTGDQARWRADGQVEFLGRIDQQIKLHGYRIEPGEIAATLLQHDDVHDCAVVVRTDPPNDARLTAYVVARNAFGAARNAGSPDTSDASPGTRHAALGADVSRAAKLRSFLAERLPASMIPAVFVELDALPLTPNGKLDRRALPAPDPAALEPSAADVAPRDAGEELLAGIWAEVLRRARISVHDRFFDLGGHSLLATQVVARVRQVFGVDLPLRALFEAPTVAGLARRISALQSSGGMASPPIARAARDAPPPLSFAQERLWFLHQLDPSSAAYHLPYALRLDGPLDRAALGRAFAALVARHESLRTTFRLHADAPVQQITRPAPFVLPLLDLAALPAARAAALTRQLARSVAQRPFDLQKGPLLRLALVRLRATDHLLLVTLHHIIADAWSLEVLIREMAALYAAHGRVRAAALPELPIQYADYAIWQRAWLTGATRDHQLAYWRAQLADPPPLLDLPTDYPRPAVQTFAGASAAIQLDDATVRALHALSRQAGSTLFMTLLAAWQALLARLSGQADILVGSPIANRTRPELEPLIGFFVNTLVLRAQVRATLPFTALLDQVRATCLAAYAHQDLPFEQLVEALHPVRTLQSSPLFQVLFVLQNAPQAAIGLGELTIRPLATAQVSAKFDLTLEVRETAQGLRGNLEYATALFAPATIVRLARRFGTLLGGIVATPRARIGDLPMLTAAERAQLLVEWNASAADYPRDAVVHQLFEAQAARIPDAVAVVCDGQALSFAALNARANQLAHTLRARGVGPDTLVALCLARSLAVHVGILGILKAGGAYVPLDPAYPAQRLSWMLADTHSPLIVTQQALEPLLPAPHPPALCLDRDWPLIAAQDAANPPRRVQPEQRAYVIFTSGSTGRPKGVMVLQRGLINLVYGLRAFFDDAAVQSVALITSISFDISVNQIFPALLFGRTLHIIPDALKFNSPALLAYVRAQRIGLMDAVPSFMQAVLHDSGPGGRSASLRYLLIGGEQLDAPLLRRLFAQLGGQVAVVNIYGLSEISDVNAFAVIRAGDEAQGVTVGRPLQHNQIYVLNARGAPQPAGVAGEVCIGGASVGRGYLGQPDLTAERFIPNPFGTMNDEARTMKEPESSFIVRRSSFGARLCRTGDLGRWRADGRLELLGRMDGQVKLRGYRIEVGEVEAALQAHPSVRLAVVLLRADAPGDQRLVAYIVQGSEDPASAILNPDPRSLIPDLRAQLAARLPAYMIPSAFVVLDALPLLPNGKVDRAALPAPDRSLRDAAQEYVAPRTPVERQVSDVIAEMLQIEQVGRNDDFFTLGGHSLLATRLTLRLCELFDINLPLRSLFEAQSVAHLAERIETLRWLKQGERSASQLLAGEDELGAI